MTDTRTHAQLQTDDRPLRVPGEPTPAERVRSARQVDAGAWEGGIVEADPLDAVTAIDARAEARTRG